MSDGFMDKGGFDDKGDVDKTAKGEKWSKINSEASAANSAMGIVDKIIKFFKAPPNKSQ